MKLGTRVKYIHIDTEEDKETGFYPPVGTFGTVVGIDNTGVRVKWDSGTNGEGVWWCGCEDVEEVEDINSELVDKIASFFEVEENWRALHSCWLEDGKSYGLRGMLHRALKTSF